MEKFKSWYMSRYKGIWSDDVLLDVDVMQSWVLHLRKQIALQNPESWKERAMSEAWGG